MSAMATTNLGLCLLLGVAYISQVVVLASSPSSCTTKADIVFILDSSSSEGSINFNKQVDFVKNFVQNFNVGPDRAQFSVLTFSTHVNNNFDLDDHETQNSLQSALSSVHYVSGITNTHLALQYARQNSFLPSNGGRSDAEKIAIVLTDGQSTSPSLTNQEAFALHTSGVEVLSVGIGSGITQSELAKIASDPQHVFRVANFDALHSIQTELANAACQKPTVACSNVKADVAFVLDSSSSIGLNDFTKQLDFVKNTIRQFDVGPTKTQFSVVSFSDQVFDEFHLNRYTSKSQVLGAISNIQYHRGTTSTHLALDHVTSETFLPANGGRPDASKVVIVLTDGQSTYSSQTKLAADRLHTTGAEVIAIGVGAGADDTELNIIATDSAHVFEVAGYDVLSSIQTELERTTCKVNECRGSKADIVFLLDSSASEGIANFNTQLEFVKNLTGQYQIGKDHVQIGLVTFASIPQNEFYLNTYDNITDLELALDMVQYSPGNTYTGDALNFVMNNSFSTANGMRDGVPHILLVMTDGQSHDPGKTAAIAKQLHHSGIKVVAIGIGSDVDQGELHNLATDANHVITVNSFNALSTIQQDVEKTTCKTENPDSECGNKPADVVFILDASGSEGQANFQKQLQFMGDFVKKFKIGPKNVQISLVTFSSYAHNEFYLSTYHDQQSILSKLQHIRYQGGTTHTETGLQYARLFHFTSTYHGARQNAQKVAIILTDGQSYSPPSTERQANSLKKLGVKIISIGIGSGINAAELSNIATDPQHVFTVSGFDTLDSIGYEIKNSACEVPTPPPTIDPECGEQIADILFLLDSSGSETRTNFNKQLNFVKNFVDQFQIGPHNVQVGLATFSTSVHEEIKLNTYHDDQSLLQAISNVAYDGGLTYTDDALKYARQTAFLPSNGGRPNATHIVVVMTDGQSYSSSATRTQADLLKNIPGTKVISIGIGNGVSRTELLDIATDSSYMFEVASFDSLAKIISETTFAACQTCGYVQQADIIFAIDASSSEGTTSFQKELNFMSRFVSDFPVGPNHVQFGLVTFGTTANNEFDLNQYSTKQSLLAAIQKANYVAGTTATGDALKMIREHSLLASSGARPSSHQYIVVLTDGASTDPSLTVSEAVKLKGTNVTVLAIGIGSNVDNKELNDIATDSRHVFNAYDFSALTSLQNEVRQATCDVLQNNGQSSTTAATTVTTTQPDTPEPDTPEPDTPMPDTPEPDTPEPDTPVPDTPEPDTPEPDTPEPDTPMPVTSIPDTPVPDTSIPDTAVPDTPEPDTQVPTTPLTLGSFDTALILTTRDCLPDTCPPLLTPFHGGGIEYLNDSAGYAGGVLIPLAGSPKSDSTRNIASMD